MIPLTPSALTSLSEQNSSGYQQVSDPVKTVGIKDLEMNEVGVGMDLGSDVFFDEVSHLGAELKPHADSSHRSPRSETTFDSSRYESLISTESSCTRFRAPRPRSRMKSTLSPFR